MNALFSRRAVRVPCVAAFVLPFVVACGSSNDTTVFVRAPPAQAEAGVDAPVDTLADAAEPSSDAAAADASVPPPPAFVSNVPGATVEDVGNPGTPQLVLLSLNFLQEPSAGQYYQQWLGEVENVGPTPFCTVGIQVTYEDANGAAVIPEWTTYLDAAPYVLAGSTETIPCLAPGAIGSFYNNAFGDSAVSTETVTTIAVKFTSFPVADAMPDPDAPTVTGAVFDTNVGYELAGTIAEPVPGAAINNVELHVYPRDATGLVLAQLSATDLGAIRSTAPVSFETDTITPAFTEYRAYLSYIDGATAGEVPRIAPGEAARRAARAETDARAALARSRR